MSLQYNIVMEDMNDEAQDDEFFDELDYEENTEDDVMMIAQMYNDIDKDMNHDRIEADLQEFSTYADVSNWEGIPKYFDTLVSVTSLVSTYENWQMRFRIVDYLVSCFGPLKDAIVEYAFDFLSCRSREKKIRRNAKLIHATAMFAVLAQRITVQLQLYVSKKQRDAIAGIAGRKGKRPAASELDEDTHGWINVQRNRMIKCLLEILQLDLEVEGKLYKNCTEYIWKPDVVDPDFLKVFADTAFGVLDDPDCVRMASQPWLEMVFRIVKCLAVDYHKVDEMAKRLLEKTMTLEYLRESNTTSYPFIEPLVTIGYSNHGAKMNRELRPLLEKITVRACAITKCNFNSLKPLSLLIQSLGEHVPDIVLIRIANIFQLLDHEAQTMRTAGLAVLYEVLRSEFLSKDICQKFDNRRRQRLLIFRKMLSHLQDQVVQTRMKVIALFTKLMELDKIPGEIQKCGIVSLIGKRLNDKSVLVRKNAMQFLSVFLWRNTFGHDFNKNMIIDKLGETTRELKLLKNPEISFVSDAEARFLAKNATIKVVIRQEVEKYVNGAPYGDLGVEGIVIEDQYEACVAKLLESSSAPLVLMHIYAKKGLLPLLQPGKSAEEQKNEISAWLYEKMFTDYVNNEVRLHNMNDEELVLEAQRIEDYHRNRNTLRDAIELCKNKLVIGAELKQCVSFALRSMVMGDVAEMRESIKFLAKCKQFNIEGSEVATRAMCALVWRNSPEVRKELLDAAADMFISRYTNMNDHNDEKHVRENSTASNLMNAMDGISDEECTSVEEVIYLLAKKNMFDKFVIMKVWEIASAINRDEKYRIDALRIIYAFTRSEFGVVESRQRLRTLQRMLSLKTNLAYEALRVISVLNTPECKDIVNDPNALDFRIPNDDSLFRSIQQLFFHGWFDDTGGICDTLIAEMMHDSSDKNWFGIMQTTIDIILGIAKDTNELIAQFVGEFMYRVRRSSEFYMFYKRIIDDVSGTKRTCASQRADYWGVAWVRYNEKFVTFIGELAVRVHIYIQNKVPKIYSKYENKLKYAEENDGKTNEEPARFLSELEISMLKKRAVFGFSLESSNGEAELSAHQMTRSFGEKRVLRYDRILGRLLPIVVYALRAKNMPGRIRDAAAFAFGKYMTISKKHAEFASPTFFTLMSRSEYSLVRSNLLAACSDFALFQPNMFELYATGLYKMARDVDAATRESAILILSYLMSNDMIQVRGALSEPARCLCDDVIAVQSIAASFFSDLNRRGDAILNLLPEFIYRLACTNERVPFQEYQQIFQFLISLPREGKTRAANHVDNMIERVCSKFSALELNIHDHSEAAKYLAFALSKFTLSDSAFFKLRDGIRHWSRFLNHRSVANSFSDMLTILIKNTKNEEVKIEAEGLMARISRIQKEGLTADAVAAPVNTPKKPRNRKGAPALQTKKRTRRPVFSPGSDSD